MLTKVTLYVEAEIKLKECKAATGSDKNTLKTKGSALII